MILTKSILNRLNSFVLVFSFFALWLSVYLSNETESILSYILILSIGIIHGANDLKLLKDTQTHFILRLIIYIIVVLLTALLFFQFIALATLLFIVLSAYHFGEQHWEIRIVLPQSISFPYFGVYGLLIFSLLFGLNAQESSLILYDLTGYELTSNFFTILIIASGALWFIMSMTLYLKKHKTFFFWLQELFFITILALIFKTASLIWAFAIYFIVWHSLPSLLSQLLHLYGKAEKREMLKYIKSSIIYWFGAIAFLAVLFYFLKDHMDMFLSILVAFLAAITLPHSLVMRKMFTSKRNE